MKQTANREDGSAAPAKQPSDKFDARRQCGVNETYPATKQREHLADEDAIQLAYASNSEARAARQQAPRRECQLHQLAV